jgi:hypothetical protein
MTPEPNLGTIRYAIDAADKICFVDDAWGLFADANDGADLSRSAMVGRSLWDCITDHATRTLYQQVVARVRQGQLAEFTLRCDGPSCRRLLQMTIRSAANGVVEFETRTVQVIPRTPQSLLDRGTPRSTALVRSCAWCNRINVGTTASEWVEVEDAVERLRLFERELAPQLTHGICETCLEGMMGVIRKLEASA